MAVNAGAVRVLANGLTAAEVEARLAPALEAMRRINALIDVLEAQGKKDEAAMHREHFTPMWQFADIKLKGSRIDDTPT